MATLHRETDVLDRILTECEDDYVGLWSIYRQVKEAGIADAKAFTLALIDFLLSVGMVEAGVPDDSGGFHAWNLNPTDAILRIEKEWSSLGRKISIGDIVWFTTPTTST
jgi:hypothetical protein